MWIIQYEWWTNYRLIQLWKNNSKIIFLAVEISFLKWFVSDVMSCGKFKYHLEFWNDFLNLLRLNLCKNYITMIYVDSTCEKLLNIFFQIFDFFPFFVFFICNKNLPLQYQSVKCWNRVINALRPLFWDHLRNLNITYIFHYDVLSNLSPTVTYNTLEFPYNKTFNQMN